MWTSEALIAVEFGPGSLIAAADGTAAAEGCTPIAHQAANITKPYRIMLDIPNPRQHAWSIVIGNLGVQYLVHGYQC